MSWRKRNLIRLYGVPPNMARLAYDIHRTLKDAALYPKGFIVHGKFSLKCQTPLRGALKDNGTKNFYLPDLSGLPMEYLISYFCLSTAYSCEGISQ